MDGRLIIALAILAVIGLGYIAWACCIAAGAADEATDEVAGDLPNLPRGLLRSRPASFRDVTIVELHPREDRTKG